MSFRTNPPDFFVSARFAVTRFEASILIMVPFFDEIGIQSFKIVFALDRVSPGTVRTTRVFFHSVTGSGLPNMTFFSFPPNFSAAMG